MSYLIFAAGFLLGMFVVFAGMALGVLISEGQRE